jgi:outer membrane protein insertion porin family
VVDFTFEGGIVELCIGEALVKDVQLQFVDQKSGTVKEEGATKPDIITRHLTTKPGRVYSLRSAKADIDSIYSTGLFEDVNIVPKEAEESTEISPKVSYTLIGVCRISMGGGLGNLVLGASITPHYCGKGELLLG